MPDRNTTLVAGMVIVAVVLSGLLGFYAYSISAAVTPGSSNTQNAKTSSTVNLNIVPDFGGSGFDAFVVPANIDGSVPSPGSNTTSPGLNNNNITVPANTPVKFVITTIDTAVLMNFSGTVSTPFVIYNDTNNGQVGVNYSKGQSVSNLPVGHTFTVTGLGLNIPIPPDTVVTFTQTFTQPGVYVYLCETPCGQGMGISGYMSGFLIVK